MSISPPTTPRSPSKTTPFATKFSMHALGSSSLFLSNNSSPLYRLINEKGEDFFLQPPNPTEFTKTNTA